MGGGVTSPKVCFLQFIFYCYHFFLYRYYLLLNTGPTTNIKYHSVVTFLQQYRQQFIYKYHKDNE